jgi:SMI1-KNR4 cell-wall
MQTYFNDFDLTTFWDDNSYALKEYVLSTPSDDKIKDIEGKLGYKLPASYIELMKLHNGGIPFNTCFPTTETTSWADDHVCLTGMYGIGDEKDYSLCGGLGSQFMMEEWEYPNIGVYFCDCPSAGHDMIAFDYTKCGKDGEPEVVHVDQEDDYRITFLAKDFETFIRGLVHHEIYDDSEENYLNDEENIKHGKFSDLLQTLCSNFTEIPNIEVIIRNISMEILKEKTYFALHEDKLSYLMYDIQFLLYSHTNKVEKTATYLKVYQEMIAFGDEFSTGGYSPDFVKDWLKARNKNKEIIESKNGFHFSDVYRQIVILSMKKYE